MVSLTALKVFRHQIHQGEGQKPSPPPLPTPHPTHPAAADLADNLATLLPRPGHTFDLAPPPPTYTHVLVISRNAPRFNQSVCAQACCTASSALSCCLYPIFT